MSNQDTRIITTIGPDAGLTPEQLADFEAGQNGIVSGFPDLLLVNGELDTELLPDTFKNEKGLLSWLKKAVEALRRNKVKVTASSGLALGSFMMGNGVANADYPCTIPDYYKTIIYDDGSQLDVGMCYGNPPTTPPPTQPTIPPTQPTTPTTPHTTPTTPPPQDTQAPQDTTPTETTAVDVEPIYAQYSITDAHGRLGYVEIGVNGSLVQPNKSTRFEIVTLDSNKL